MKPTIWILTDGRIGDLKQMQVLAKNLHWPVVVKNLAFKSQFLSSFPFLAPLFLDKLSVQTLAGPLPDVVMCAGSRMAAVALFLKRQRKSAAKIVCLNRPRGGFSEFELIITTPQYAMPKASNILELNLPLTDAHGLFGQKTLNDMSVRFNHLPEPRIAVLVGGDSPPYILDEKAATNFAENINAYVQKKDGSLLLTTSFRTGSTVERAIKKVLSVPNECFFWSTKHGDNPYLAYLAAADEIIVTADSVAMTADAIATGKAVYVYDLPQHWKLGHRFVNGLALKVSGEKPPFWSPLVLPLFNWGILQKRANRIDLYRKLSEKGRVAFFGQLAPANAHGNETAEIDIAVQRVRELFSL